MNDKEIDNVCEYILNKIANRTDNEYYELYTYFSLENEELLSDNNIDPKRVLSEFEKYGLSKPLFKERCELTELGVEIGQGIGFVKYKDKEETKKSTKEKIEKRKNRLINFKYFIERPKTVIGIILIVLAFGFGITNFKELKDYFQKDKEKTQKPNQESIQEGKEKTKEIKYLKSQQKQIDSTDSKNDSLMKKT